MTIKVKIFLGYLFTFLGITGVTIFSYILVGRQLQTDVLMKEKLLQAQALASSLRGEDLPAFATPLSLKNPEYRAALQRLNQYKNADPTLTYLYLIAPHPQDQFVYVMDADIYQEDRVWVESPDWALEVVLPNDEIRPYLLYQQDVYRDGFYLNPEKGALPITLQFQDPNTVLQIGTREVLQLRRVALEWTLATPQGPLNDQNPIHDLPSGPLPLVLSLVRRGQPGSLPGSQVVNTPEILNLYRELYSQGKDQILPGEMSDSYGRFYEVAAFVRTEDGQPAGLLLMDFYTDEIEVFQAQFLGMVLMSTLPILFLAFFMAMLLARHLVSPLKTLVQAARQIQAGDFTVHLSLPREAEYRELGEAFNEMTADLDRSHQALKIHAEEMERLASIDGVTGLENRRAFFLKLGRLLSYLDRLESPPTTAVMFIDLDKFKEVNDSLGHACGDTLLNKVSERLKLSLRNTDQVFRLGGDEFTLIVSPLGRPEDAALVATKIIDSLRDPFDLEGHSVPIGASIGVSFYPQDGKEADQLIRQADTALYEAKRMKFSPVFFAPAMTERIQKAAQIREDLFQALNKGEFHLVYQPIVDQQGTLVSAEALMRWDRPGYGPVPPGEFIPILEESTQISRAGLWAIETAEKQLQTWAQEGHPLTSVSVNLSVRQLKDRDFRRRFSDALALPGTIRDHMYFEITETMLAWEPDIRALIVSYADKGGVFALDDFGTGYSSMTSLTDLPIRFLKIDKGFVDKVPGDGKTEAIIRAIVEIARALQATTIAEGVETRQQFDFLVAQGCQRFQGFLFSRPVPPQEIRGAYPLPH